VQQMVTCPLLPVTGDDRPSNVCVSDVT